MGSTDATPQPGDFKRAGALIAGWATRDLHGVHAAIQDARQVGRSFHLIAALAETCTRALDVRDNPDRLEALRRDIAKYAEKENPTND
ncbi:hypothetical protein [Mycobacterium riyadhense]|uniref:hypothetical protein n=1 Tax=Mycobacterium riyadhense TaxID=486698 RepID=UPI00195A4C1C|nr:hypothetical protein [Mycobacterium riyadhense]